MSSNIKLDRRTVKLLSSCADTSSCAFHQGILGMLGAAKDADRVHYEVSVKTARKGISPKRRRFESESSHSQRTARRVKALHSLNEFCAKAFENSSGADPSSSLNMVGEPRQKTASDLLFEKATEGYANIKAFRSIEIENAYTDPTFGVAAGNLHPFKTEVNASLLEFAPVNEAQKYVMSQMVDAVFDQIDVIKVETGEVPDPIVQAATKLGVELPTKLIVGSAEDDLPEDYPEDLRESAREGLDSIRGDLLNLFNEGWLYAFYKGVEVAKNPEFFSAFVGDDEVTKKEALKNFLKQQEDYWEIQWESFGEPEGTPKEQEKFFDGACSAITNWLETL